MTVFTVVRHGNTFAPGEPPRRIGAGTDLPLVASGRAQARAIARHFADHGIGFDRVLTSPLLRTRETASIIANLVANTPTPMPLDTLAEIDHGPDENQAEDVILARIGRDAIQAWEDRAEVPTGWVVDVPARLSGWREIFAQESDDSVLLVTSNGAARFALLCDTALKEQAQALPSLKIRTGAWGRVHAEKGKLNLLEWDIRP